MSREKENEYLKEILTYIPKLNQTELMDLNTFITRKREQTEIIQIEIIKILESCQEIKEELSKYLIKN